MENSPIVSVIIPTYNQEKYISSTIDSVLSQDILDDIEIVIGEDCSQDKTKDVLVGYQHRFPGTINAIFAKSNQGLVKNVRTLIENAKGKYIALLGGDDLFVTTNKLSMQLEFLEKNVDFGVVHTDGEYLFSLKNGKGYAKKNIHKHKRRSIPIGEVYEDLLKKNFIIASSAFIRKDLIRKHVDFEVIINNKFLMEDLPMWLFLAKATKFGYIDKTCVCYRVLGNSMSHPVDKTKSYSFDRSVIAIRNYFINEFGCTQETRDAVDSLNRLLSLEHAFRMNNNELARRCIKEINCKSKLNVRVTLLYLGTCNRFCRLFVKIINRIFRLHL